MRTNLLISVVAIAIVAPGCGKKKKDDPAATQSGGTVSGIGATLPAGVATNLAVSSVTAIPDASAFVASSSQSASSLWLEGNNDFNLVTGTPPDFKDVSGNLSLYLTGDTSALVNAIDADRALNTAAGWADMKAQLATFFQAQQKCQIMEHTARIVSRLKEDTGTLCMLKNIGSIGDKVFSVKSGAPIADLTKVFGADTNDKLLQFAMGDGKTFRFEIKGTSNLANGYQLTMTQCDTNNKPTQQNIVKIDNAAGSYSFTSKRNDVDGAKARVANFSLAGAMVADGKGGYIVDTSKARTVTYANSGTFGAFTSSNQGSLAINGNVLDATFFESHAGGDPNGKSSTGIQKDRLSVQYTGTSSDDLAIFQGANQSVSDFTGMKSDGTSFSQSHAGSIAFAFDSAMSPQYATQATSTYLNTVASVDFTKDPILSQTAPAAPDVVMDATQCTQAATTILAFATGSEALIEPVQKTCNDFKQQKNGNMCEALRSVEQKVFQAMNFRKTATGSAEN